ncbi:hypothetical protein V8E55_001590 [Tylopilus felleus]
MDRVYKDDISDELVRNTPGNASIDVKALVHRWLHVFTQYGYGTRSVRGLNLVEISIVPNDEEPTRRAARVALEMTVTQDMLNVAGKLHGACTVHLVDMGDRLRLINTSTTVGARVWSSRIEIWDVTHHWLVASATQVKMEASSSKL